MCVIESRMKAWDPAILANDWTAEDREANIFSLLFQEMRLFRVFGTSLLAKPASLARCDEKIFWVSVGRNMRRD